MLHKCCSRNRSWIIKKGHKISRILKVKVNGSQWVRCLLLKCVYQKLTGRKKEEKDAGNILFHLLQHWQTKNWHYTTADNSWHQRYWQTQHRQAHTVWSEEVRGRWRKRKDIDQTKRGEKRRRRRRSGKTSLADDDADADADDDDNEKKVVSRQKKY